MRLNRACGRPPSLERQQDAECTGWYLLPLPKHLLSILFVSLCFVCAAFSSSPLPDESPLSLLSLTVVDPPERDSPPLSAALPLSRDEIAPRPGLLMCVHTYFFQGDWTPRLRGKISIESATAGSGRLHCTIHKRVLRPHHSQLPCPTPIPTPHRIQRSVTDVVRFEWAGLPGRLSR